MLRFCKMLIVCLALAGLPLQAVAAAGMAFCLPDDHGHADFHDHSHHHAPQDSDESQLPGPGVAGDEVLCHHCSAAALPALQPHVIAAAAADHAPGLAPYLFLFFPEQPQRPPLA